MRAINISNAKQFIGAGQGAERVTVMVVAQAMPSSATAQCEDKRDRHRRGHGQQHAHKKMIAHMANQLIRLCELHHVDRRLRGVHQHICRRCAGRGGTMTAETRRPAGENNG